MARLTFLQIRKSAFGEIWPVLLSSCSLSDLYPKYTNAPSKTPVREALGYTASIGSRVILRPSCWSRFTKYAWW